MKLIRNLVDSYSSKHRKKLNKITSHLLEHFGIEYFCYQKVSDSGQWCLIGNNPDWLHFSADNAFYRNDPSLVHPKNTQTGYFFPELYQNPVFRDTFIDHAVLKFGLQSSLVSIKKHPGFAEYFVFSSKLDKSLAYPIYMNNLKLLTNLFADYFKRETCRILTKMDDYSVDLKSINDSPFVIGALGVQIPMVGKSFLNACSRYPSLTERELDCVLMYSKGYTAKETAKLLNISHRTVEEYLYNTKKKLCVDYKHQLLNHPAMFELIG